MSDSRSPDQAGTPIHPPVGARAPGLDELVDPVADEGWDRDDEPNFFARRLVVIGVAVALVAIGAVVVFQLIGGDDEASSSEVDDDWNTLVVVTEEEIRLVDRDASTDDPDNLVSGEVVDGASVDPLADELLQIGTSLLSLDDRGRLTITDLTDGEQTTERVVADSSISAIVSASGVAVIGSTLGGDVSLVRVSSGSVVTAGEVAEFDDPLIFPYTVKVNRDGTHAVVSDARTFQSAVIDLDDETAEFLGGLAADVDATQAVTVQRRGDQAEIEFYDLDGERTGSVDAVSPLGIAIDGPGSVILVGEDGSVQRANADGDIDELAGLATDDGEPIVPTGLVPIRSGDVLAVVAEDRLVLLGRDGTQIAVIDGIPAPTFQLTPDRQCVATTGGGSGVRGTVSVWDAATGERHGRAESAIVIGASLDGCVVIVDAGSEVSAITADRGTIDLDRRSVVAVSPDGESYVWRDGDAFRLTSLGDEDEDEGIVVASDELARVYFIER